MSLAGRRVVLTGATGGLGRMLAPALVASGASVALVARNEGDLNIMQCELGSSTIAVLADVTAPTANDMVAQRVVDEWGGLDVWIANAGISPIVKKPVDIDPADFQRIIEVNLCGAFWGAQAALRVLGEGGRVIVTSSVLGQRPSRGLCAYTVSKAGLEGLVRALALDVASQGVTVNAVAPGWFDSPMAEPFMTNERRASEILSHVPMKRWGKADDLVGAFVFLASRASDFVTGTVIPVDGGYLLV